jgi:hypothetical protein
MVPQGFLGIPQERKGIPFFGGLRKKGRGERNAEPRLEVVVLGWVGHPFSLKVAEISEMEFLIVPEASLS